MTQINNERWASLDLGSNTFILLIAEVRKDSIHTIADEVRVVRLGQGVDQHRMFSTEALRRAESCLEEFHSIIASHRVDHVVCVATSAARDVRNSQALVDMITLRGWRMAILTGEQEARVSYAGSCFDVTELQSPAVIDVGGGSTEILVTNPNFDRNWFQGKLHSEPFASGHSFDVGSVRISERYQLFDRASSEHLLRVRRELQSVFLEKASVFQSKAIDGVIAVAGTPTTIVQLRNQDAYSEALVHRQSLTLREIDQWVDRLALMTATERSEIPAMPKGRGDVLLAGALILSEALRFLGTAKALVSVKGVRYGALVLRYQFPIGS